MISVVLNSFDISTFNKFYFLKGDRFPATLSFTHDAVLNSMVNSYRMKT